MKRTVSIAAACAATLVVGLATQSAHAQKMEVLDLKLVVSPKDAKKKEKPVYRAKISHSVPGLSADKFTLKDMDVDPPIEAAATKAIDYTQSDEPMSLVVLIQGDERWVGNETYVPEDDPDQMQGAFSALADAVDALSKAGPEGSLGAVMFFAGGQAEVKYPMGPVAGMSGALGAQQDFKEMGVPLIVGLDQAYKLLAGASGRKILVVIGDGTGQEEDISPKIEERRKKLEALGAETFSIYFAAVPTENPVGGQNMKRLGYTGSYEAAQRDNFSSKGADIAAKISTRYYVDFPAEPFATPDKKMRELTVFVNKDEGDPVEIGTVRPASVPSEGGSLWWLWLLIVLATIVVVVIIVVKRGNREPAPPPMVMQEAAPDPGPAQPHKTVMLGIGGQDDGMPIVGWVVPLTGPNQYQTFKLLQGATLIGTGGDAHVIVDDGFMSTVHSEIVCSAAGFILNDGGSTNGTFVNEKRIASHELVDNDVFTLGKTDFKFKSIN